MAINQRLAATDPSNTEWQGDLSASHIGLGDVQKAQGDLAAALRSYQAGMEIAQKLAATDLGNLERQRELTLGHEKIRDVQRAMTVRRAEGIQEK